jgi:hypothetical protein
MPARLAQQEDGNGRFCCNRMVSNFDLCSLELACSADPQGRTALAGLRHLAKQKAAESVMRLRATIAANSFNFSALVNRTAGIFYGEDLRRYAL